MATFRIYYESPIDFNPEIHQDIHGADNATTFYNSGIYLNFFKMYGIKEIEGDYDYIWEATVWISNYQKSNIEEIIRNGYGDDVIFCQETCNYLLNKNQSKSIPEGDLIISILFIGVLGIIGLKRKIAGT